MESNLPLGSKQSAGNGILYLIPVPLAPEGINTIPENVRAKACSLKYYFVENLRTARRFLKAMDASVEIDAIRFSELNRNQPADLPLLKIWLESGFEIGVMSEAGCPGVADPGAELVQRAHQLQARVVPFVGPNSMLLALMASGFNGQGYRFAGYLPLTDRERGRAIKEMEARSAAENETQIFMETPYRNRQLLLDLLKHCRAATRLCIAVNLSAPDEQIMSKTINEWSKGYPDLHKKPAVFLLMS
jgi:16S rRNA (cytidine1402-2'-O)-methyltransferase